MSRIHEILREQLIEKEKQNRQEPVIGEIEYFDHKNNRAMVKIPNKYVNKAGIGDKDHHIRLRQVPISLQGGVHSAGPFKGDKVWVHFQNGDIKQPYVTGGADTTYAHTTRRDRTEHGTKGGFLPHNGISKKDNFKSKDSPQWFTKSLYGEDWTRNLNHYSKTIKGKMTKETRTNNEIKNGRGKVNKFNESALKSVQSVLADSTDSSYKGHAEIGVFHPFHTSGIKIKDNAQIDIFTHPHQGIRIDPDTRSVNINSEWMKFHNDEFRAWITGQAQWRIKGNWVCEVKGTHETHSDGLYEIHSRKGDVHIEAEKGHVRIIAAKSIRLKAGTDIILEAGGKIRGTAGTHIGLKAPRIDWN